MNEGLVLAAAGLAGALLGGAFFAGLWWTVHRGVGSPRPALWFGVSLLLRMSLLLAVLYFVGRDHWPRLLACLAGFALARWILTAHAREAHHAP